MSTLMLFMEIFFSIHCLLFLSSWLIKRSWLKAAPSFKLKVARLLLISCILSPVAVHCLRHAEKPLIAKFVSFDVMQEYANQPILKPKQSVSTLQSEPLSTMTEINYWQLLFILLCIMAFFRGYHFVANLKKLNTILRSAIPYRASGRLVIKVSHNCHIPFSVRWFNKAYIIIPLSLVSSSQNVKIAIAHEGQHHRNGDCLWAYMIEGIRIVFFGNPGVSQWHRILSELQEFSCDEALIGHQRISAHDYGHCLFKVVQTVSQYSKSSERELACTVGMALSSGKQESTLIIRRINMLSKYQSNSSKRSLLGIAFAGVAIVAPICTAYAAMGSLSSPRVKEVDTSFLDPKIQHIAAEEIASAVKQYHAKSGAIAVIDPSTGKIIAFAEAGKNNGAKNWQSRTFVPASTIKPFVAAAAIDSGVASESKIYDCHSPYYVEDTKFTNWDPTVGSVSVAEAIAKSVNICLIKVAQDTGSVVFREKLTGFGFDMNSWWQSDKSDAVQLANAALGVNVPVTLETLTKSYTVLANKGHLSSPNSDAVISETTAHSVTHMLEGVVQSGTGKEAAIAGVAVAGKTGTLADEAQGTNLALFGGYVPADAPRYVMVVIIEDGYKTANGEKLNSGGALAAPVFHNVAVKSLEIRKK